MRRMWLSPGMRLIPNRVFALERPCPASSWRWWARKEGLWAKNTENAAKPKSAMVYEPLCPVRGSGKPSQPRRTAPIKRSSTSMAPLNQT